MKIDGVCFPDYKAEEFYKIRKLVNRYNSIIDELEGIGLTVGYEYDGHMTMGYNKHERQFYVSVKY